MGFMIHIMGIGLWLVRVGLDVCLFFMLVRLVLMWRSFNWLERFNRSGKELVDALAGTVGWIWQRATQKQLSERGKLLVSLAALALVRLVIVEFGRML